MKKYTKPEAQVVELSVKESISALTTKQSTIFGFDGKKSMTLTTYASADSSVTIAEKIS